MKRGGEFQKFLNREDYRNLAPAAQGVKLMAEQGAKLSEACKATGTDKNAIKRAKKALEEGREVGVNGRPKNLRPGEEEELARIVQSNIEKKTPLTYLEFKDEVCTVPSLLKITFCLR